MSRYLARLKALVAEDACTRLTDKTDARAFVTFVSDQSSPVSDDESAIEERAGLAADSVPPCYLNAWARLQCQRPSYATEEAWRRAVVDVGRFLDGWGADAQTMQWTVGELFDVPRHGRPGGLAWQLTGELVEALGEHRARLAGGRTILRAEIRGWQ
jgi:hypothetical protein